MLYHFVSIWIPGTSNERASSAEGGDGLPVQNWKFWGEYNKLDLPLLCVFQSSWFNILSLHHCYRLPPPFRENWIQMLLCKDGWPCYGKIAHVMFFALHLPNEICNVQRGYHYIEVENIFEVSCIEKLPRFVLYLRL